MCDSVVATGAYTASGATIFAKNSDRHGNECQPFVQFPESLHARRGTLRCTHIAIPQVAETYRVMGHSPWWVWGFEHGVNEHGVAIGNHTVFSREPVEEEAGLIGMDLVRLGLERGRDAREALEVIAALLEKYGQGGAALAPGESGYHNSFTLADPTAAWQLETSGRRWVARKVERGALTNHITLGSDWLIGSRDVDSFARAEGWWRDPARLDMAGAYRHPMVPGEVSEGRLRRSLELLHADASPHEARSMQNLLRDHGAGAVGPPYDAGPEEERYFTLCMHAEPAGTTTASLIAELPTDRESPWPVWIAFASPCFTTFLPVYLEGVIPAELARGSESDESASAWWAFRRLSVAAESAGASLGSRLRKEWASFEERVEQERQVMEVSGRAAAAAGDHAKVGELATAFMQKTVDTALAEAERLRELILE